jgi:RNA polymerase sigma-70 factor, ECF subfamily
MSEEEFKDSILPLSRRLFSVSFRILRSTEDAEDAVQETLLKIWNMRSRLKEYNSPEALAMTMVRNYSIDSIRKRRTESLDAPGLKFEGKPDNESPFEILKEKETTEIIETILKGMADQYSSVIRRRDIEGLEYEEIAALTDQSVNTVRVAVSRARKMVRDEYNRIVYEADTGKRIAQKVL